MYFTVNLAFVDHLDELNEVVETPIDRNWTNQKQILPISLESFEINSSLLQVPKTLKEYINQYQEKRKMDIQEVQIKNENHNSKFKAFITSFIVDAIGFMAAFLSMIVTLIIIYVLTGQSKLKTLVANIPLQCVKAVEPVALNLLNQNWKFGLVKFLMILNLFLVTLMALAKVKKSKIFKGRLFSNSVKIKLLIANTQFYIPLDLNKIARNVHLFKLNGILNIDDVTLKKNWIWDVLEVDWTDVSVSLNDCCVIQISYIRDLLVFKSQPYYVQAKLYIYPLPTRIFT